MHAGVAETAVIGTADELTGQAVHAFVTLKPYVFFLHRLPFILPDDLLHREFSYDGGEAELKKELTLQVRKVIGPFAAPKKIYIVADLPKTRSGKVTYFSSLPLIGFTDRRPFRRSCAASCERSSLAKATSSATCQRLRSLPWSTR